MDREVARAKAQKYIDRVRNTGGVDDYSDAQIWYAILRAKSTMPDLVKLEFLCHVLDGRTQPYPSAEYLDNPPKVNR